MNPGGLFSLLQRIPLFLFPLFSFHYFPPLLAFPFIIAFISPLILHFLYLSSLPVWLPQVLWGARGGWPWVKPFSCGCSAECPAVPGLRNVHLLLPATHIPALIQSCGVHHFHPTVPHPPSVKTAFAAVGRRRLRITTSAFKISRTFSRMLLPGVLHNLSLDQPRFFLKSLFDINQS